MPKNLPDTICNDLKFGLFCKYERFFCKYKRFVPQAPLLTSTQEATKVYICTSSQENNTNSTYPQVCIVWRHTQLHQFDHQDKQTKLKDSSKKDPIYDNQRYYYKRSTPQRHVSTQIQLRMLIFSILRCDLDRKWKFQELYLTYMCIWMPSKRSSKLSEEGKELLAAKGVGKVGTWWRSLQSKVLLVLMGCL